MLDKLKAIEERYEQLGNELLEVGNNYQRAAEINKERVDLEPIYRKGARIPSGNEKPGGSQSHHHFRE